MVRVRYVVNIEGSIVRGGIWRKGAKVGQRVIDRYTNPFFLRARKN